MKNYSWAISLRVIIRLATFIRIAILARILTTSQFGLFGIATIILSLLEILTETGINVFLIQEKDPLEKYIDTAWVISIVRGILIASTIIITAPLVANFFHASNSIWLIYLTAIIPFIRGFINPACVRFQKNLQFDREFVYRFSITIIESLSIIILALLTHNTSSFIWGMIISAVSEVIFSFTFIHPAPKLEYISSIGKSIFQRGKWVTGMGLLDYVYSTGDNIIVGRYLGQSALGIYQNAYKLSALPVTEMVGVYNTVSFPGFSRISHDTRFLKRIAIRNFLFLFTLLLLGSITLFILAGPIVLIGLGPSWLAAVPVVQTLAFLGLFRGITSGMNSLFLSLKKQHLVTAITLFNALGLIITIIPFVQRFGIMGAAYSAMFGSLLAIPLGIYFTLRTLSQLK